MIHRIYVPAPLVYIQEWISGASYKRDIKVRVKKKKGLSFKTWKADNLSEMPPYPGISEVCSGRPRSILGQLVLCLEQNARYCDCQ